MSTRVEHTHPSEFAAVRKLRSNVGLRIWLEIHWSVARFMSICIDDPSVRWSVIKVLSKREGECVRVCETEWWLIVAWFAIVRLVCEGATRAAICSCMRGMQEECMLARVPQGPGVVDHWSRRIKGDLSSCGSGSVGGKRSFLSVRVLLNDCGGSSQTSCFYCGDIIWRASDRKGHRRLLGTY